MNNNDNDKFIILLLSFILFTLWQLLFFNVSADDFKEYEYFNGHDESGGYIIKEKQVDEINTEEIMEQYGIQMFQSASEEDEVELYIDYDYWFIYEDYVYVSNRRFNIRDDSIVVDDEFASHSFKRFEIGLIDTNEIIWEFSPPRIDLVFADYSKIKSNYSIVDNGTGLTMVERTTRFEAPDGPEGFNYRLDMGHYTFYSDVSLGFFGRISDGTAPPYRFGRSTTERKARSGVPDNLTPIYYSYMGSELFEGRKYTSSSDSGPLRTYRTGWRVPDNLDPLIKLVSYSNDIVLLNSDTDPWFNPSSPPDDWEPFETYVGRGAGDGEEEEGSILSYLNPFSENFFLKIALIPSDKFFQNEILALTQSPNGVNNEFHYFLQSLANIFSGEYGVSTWDGVGYGNKTLKAMPIRKCSYPNDFNYQDCDCNTVIGAGTCKNDVYAFYFNLSDFNLVDAIWIQDFIIQFRYYVDAVMNLWFVIWFIKWCLSLFGANMPKDGNSSGPSGPVATHNWTDQMRGY